MNTMATARRSSSSSLPLDVSNPIAQVGRLNPPKRLLCGPGPSNAHPRVHAAMSLPMIGHMDECFVGEIMGDTEKLLKYAFQTTNAFTFPVSGAASAAWEAAVVNLTSPGDLHLVFVNGHFGERHYAMALKHGANVKRVEKRWGEVFTLEEIKDALYAYRPQLMWICLAETSTGAVQPVEGIGEFCAKLDCLFLLDTVTAVGGMPVYLDRWQVDAAYTGAQKCLSCPPGISALTLGHRALQKIQAREEKGETIRSWYLDLSLIRRYLFAEGPRARVYHHTAPISMAYALRESLSIVAEEGLESVWKRHAETADYFWRLLEEAGLELFIENKSHRSTALHTIKVPTGVDAAQVVEFLKERHSVEIGGGLGPQMAGKVWRVGLMGYNSRPEVALTVVAALKEALAEQRWTPKAHMQ